MKRYKVKIVFHGLLMLSINLSAQQWSLRDCIDYAQKENIQVKKSLIATEGYQEDFLLSKAALFPSLSGSVAQKFSNSKLEDANGNYRYDGVFNGQYGLNASWVIYNGKQNINATKQARLNKEVSEWDKEEILNNIEISISQTYLQIIYAWESIKNNENILASSEVQLKQSKDFLDAGSITGSEYAQVEAQRSSDKYNLVLAQNSYDNYKLQLKQLLELDYNQQFDIVIPNLDNALVLEPIPDKNEVYKVALTFMPQIQSSQVQMQLADLNKSTAKAGYLPSLSVNGSLGTGNIYNGSSTSFFTQLDRNFNQSIGLTLSIPIFDNRKNKTAVKKANLQIQTVELDYLDTKKELYRTVESLYQDAVSGQSKYVAAHDKMKSAKLSYQLVQEQYSLGIRNTVELTTEKNNYANALQELLQAKYTALLSLKLLNFYQGQKITL